MGTHHLQQSLAAIQIGFGTSSNDSSLLGLDYDHGTTNNNGNLRSQRIVVGSPDVTQSYSHDAVNRLVSAEEKTTTSQIQLWKQAFSYDRFGNRTFDTGNTTANVLGPNPSFDVNTTTNRFAAGQGYSYDNAGNVTAEPGGKSYAYDAENHQTSFTQSGTTSYAYDGDGKRVRKTNADSSAVVYVYDAGGRLIAEYTSTSNSLGGGTNYLTQDHLGSTRVVTLSSGDVKSQHDYLPFGEDLLVSRSQFWGYGAADNLRQKFTGHERDQESGLDFAQARYCSSATGRFMSADSVMGSIGNPQSLNLYAYVMNNPMKYVDPTGHDYRATNSAGGNRTISDADLSNYKLIESTNTGHSVVLEDSNGVRWSGQFVDNPVNNDVDVNSDQPVIMSAADGEFYRTFGQYVYANQRADGMIPDPFQSGFTRGLFGTRWVDPNSVSKEQWWNEQRMALWLRYSPLMIEGVGPESELPGASDALTPLGRGNTGRTVPASLGEQLAMEEVRSNPSAGTEIQNITMNDARWPASNGWVKMRQRVNGVEVHYVYNRITNQVDDFKFK